MPGFNRKLTLRLSDFLPINLNLGVVPALHDDILGVLDYFPVSFLDLNNLPTLLRGP